MLIINRSEQYLENSGIAVAPPPRTRKVPAAKVVTARPVTRLRQQLEEDQEFDEGIIFIRFNNNT